MLDTFLSTHPRLVFADRRKVDVSDDAFEVAFQAAKRQIDPPVRTIFNNEKLFRRFELLYAMVVEEELAMHVHATLGRLDRLLVEVVILHKLLQAEMQDADDSPSTRRAICTIGWMIQERLVPLLLQTRTFHYQRLHRLGRTVGMDKDAWESRLAGASAEAKAILELACVPNLNIYQPHVWEDMGWGIDLFVELEGTSAGACLSVKLTREPHTRLYTNQLQEAAERLTQDWGSIRRGTEHFCRSARRIWLPMLLYVSKRNGYPVNLNAGKKPADWTNQLRAALVRADKVATSQSA